MYNLTVQAMATQMTRQSSSQKSSGAGSDFLSLIRSSSQTSQGNETVETVAPSVEKNEDTAVPEKDTQKTDQPATDKPEVSDGSEDAAAAETAALAGNAAVFVPSPQLVEEATVLTAATPVQNLTAESPTESPAVQVDANAGTPVKVETAHTPESQTAVQQKAVPSQEESQEQPAAAQTVQNSVNSSAETDKSAPTQNRQQPTEQPVAATQETGEDTSAAAENGQQPLQAKAQDADTVFIKVGDGNSEIRSSETLPEDVGETILVKLSEGKQQFDVELSPAELGKIRIQITFEDGKATVLMRCSNPETQQLLNAGAQQLRNIVESGTGLQTTVTVKSDAQEAAFYQNSEQQGENQAREEQKERMREQQELQPEKEVSAFIQRFRLEFAGSFPH